MRGASEPHRRAPSYMHMTRTATPALLATMISFWFAMPPSMAQGQEVGIRPAPSEEPTAPAATQRATPEARAVLRWASEAGPAEFIVTWMLAIQRNELGAAAEMVHGVPDTPEAKQTLHKQLEFLRSVKADDEGVVLLPAAWRVEGDAAILVMVEKQAEGGNSGVGYWFLHRIGERWHILFEPNSYKLASYRFTPEQVAEYEAVEQQMWDLMYPKPRIESMEPAATQPTAGGGGH